jgi:hypothetical protein
MEAKLFIVVENVLYTLWFNPCIHREIRNYYIQFDDSINGDTILNVNDYFNSYAIHEDVAEWIETSMQAGDLNYTPIDISTILLNPTELYFMKSNEAFGVIACMNNIMQRNSFTIKDLYHSVIELGIRSAGIPIDGTSLNTFLSDLFGNHIDNGINLPVTIDVLQCSIKDHGLDILNFLKMMYDADIENDFITNTKAYLVISKDVINEPRYYCIRQYNGEWFILDNKENYPVKLYGNIRNHLFDLLKINSNNDKKTFETEVTNDIFLLDGSLERGSEVLFIDGDVLKYGIITKISTKKTKVSKVSIEEYEAVKKP